MNRFLGMVGILAAAGLNSAFGAVVYQNTTTDTLNTVDFSSISVSQFGDQIHVDGTERTATFALVQLFNNGAAGTADFTLRLFSMGSPVGAQIGSDFVVTGVAVPGFTDPEGGVFNVGFSLPNLLVPDDLIFTVEFGNQSARMNIVGVNLFEPPTVGSSDNTFGIGYNGAFGTYSTPEANVFFELDTNAPEPGTFAIAGCGLVAVLFARRRRAV